MIEPSKVVLPKAAYKFRVIKAVRGTSQAGQPKADVDVELYDNADITLDDPDDGSKVTQSPNGMQLRTWLSFQKQSLGAVNTFLRAVGMPKIGEGELDTFNPELLVGKTGIGVVSGRLKDNVGADKQPIINPYTNKPSTIADNKFTEFFAKPA